MNPETVFGIIGGYFAVDGDSLLNDRSYAFRDNFRQDNNINPQLTFSEDIQQNHPPQPTPFGQ